MYTYRPTDNEHIHIYGRTVMQDPLPLFWTASGLEFTTDSTECFLDVECDYGFKEEYLRVEMDGFCIQRFLVPAGRSRLCLFMGFPPGEMKKINVRLEAQPMQDDEKRKLLIHGINCDCVLQPVVPKAMRIEFIGDSLTSGEGLTGTPARKEWCTGIFGLNGHYALETAAHFDADYSIVSQSGWGIYSGWDNNLRTNIPAYYTQVCGLLEGKENEALGAKREHDFTAWQPDVIIINLATNDGAAASNPAWTDPDTGKAYKQNFGPDGRLDAESEVNFRTAALGFLYKVRENNPGAHIIWAYGMCDHVMEPHIKEAIDAYRSESGDAKAEYLSLPSAEEDQLGAHAHPGAEAHHAAAQTIIARLEEL